MQITGQSKILLFEVISCPICIMHIAEEKMGEPEDHSIQHIGGTLWEPSSQTSMRNGISTTTASHLHSKSLLGDISIFVVLTLKEHTQKRKEFIISHTWNSINKPNRMIMVDKIVRIAEQQNQFPTAE